MGPEPKRRLAIQRVIGRLRLPWIKTLRGLTPCEAIYRARQMSQALQDKSCPIGLETERPR